MNQTKSFMILKLKNKILKLTNSYYQNENSAPTRNRKIPFKKHLKSIYIKKTLFFNILFF